MYNCKNCDNTETLYFQCDKCNQELCRKCINQNKHICVTRDTEKLKLDMFCDDFDCINTKNLLHCKKCNKKFCEDHKKNHNCKKKASKCIIC